MTNQKKILIVEDKLIPAEYLSCTLKDNGYRVLEIADSGKKAIEIARRGNPDVVLMDIMLKGQMSGTEAAMEICYNSSTCKIIYLTAYSNKEIIESAYDSRAYAYLLKPYREKEILATVQLALLQKEKKRPNSNRVKLIDEYYFDIKICRLCKNNKEVSLSKNGHKFMEILAKSINTTVSNEQICYHIWYKNRSDNVLRALVHRIREKTNAHLIENVKGVGYITYQT